jgi:hypothetical protein
MLFSDLFTGHIRHPQILSITGRRRRFAANNSIKFSYSIVKEQTAAGSGLYIKRTID